MKNRERRKLRPKGDKWAGLRTTPGAIVPALVEGRTAAKYADPEDILQNEVNNVLHEASRFQFRISANVYAHAGDDSIAGWPDSPLFERLAPGLALCGPMELKRVGETLNPSQLDMQRHLGTVEIDNWETAWAYMVWFWAMAESMKKYLALNPPPPLPKGIKV